MIRINLSLVVLSLCSIPYSYAVGNNTCDLTLVEKELTELQAQTEPKSQAEKEEVAAVAMQLAKDPDALHSEVMAAAEAVLMQFQNSPAFAEPLAAEVIAKAEEAVLTRFQKFWQRSIEPVRQWAYQRYGDRGGMLVFGAYASGAMAVPMAPSAGLVVAAPIVALAELSMFLNKSARKFFFVSGSLLTQFIATRIDIDNSVARLDRAVARANKAMPANAPWDIYQAGRIADLEGRRNTYYALRQEAQEQRLGR